MLCRDVDACDGEALQGQSGDGEAFQGQSCDCLLQAGQVCWCRRAAEAAKWDGMCAANVAATGASYERWASYKRSLRWRLRCPGRQLGKIPWGGFLGEMAWAEVSGTKGQHCLWVALSMYHRWA